MQRLAYAKNISELKDAWESSKDDMIEIKKHSLHAFNFLIAHKDWIKKEIGKEYAK